MPIYKNKAICVINHKNDNYIYKIIKITLMFKVASYERY